MSSQEGSGAKFSTGTQLFDYLTVLFVYLKLTNQIEWTWIWVLWPIWVQGAIFLVAAVAAFTFMYVKGKL
jgi:hypothetical protein